MRTTHFALVCALFTACAWGGDTGTGDGDGDDEAPQDPAPAPQCGDGTCAPSEVGTCASDCGSGNPSNPVCGNGTCEAGESPSTCANDCQASGPVCGDGTCDMAGGENSSNCAGDCSGGGGGGGNLDCSDFAVLFACAACMDDPSSCSSLGVDEASCQQCLGGGGGGMGCGDGVCDSAAGEDPNTCPFDCQ